MRLQVPFYQVRHCICNFFDIFRVNANVEVSRTTWARAAAELFIIIAGVTLALAGDRWREAEHDNDLALSYIARLQSDLETDLRAFEETAEWAKAIDDSALYVLNIYEGTDPTPATYDVLAYHIFRASWNVQGRTTSATYQDLISTGNLGLLPVRLRNEIADYYALREFYQQRVERYEAPEATEYWDVPDIVLGPILGPRIWVAIQGRGRDFLPESGKMNLSNEEVDRIVLSLRDIKDLETQIAEVRNQMVQRKILFGERIPNAAQKLAEFLSAEASSK